MDEVEFNVEIVKEELVEFLYVECFNMYFIGVKGVRIRV